MKLYPQVLSENPSCVYVCHIAILLALIASSDVMGERQAMPDCWEIASLPVNIWRST